MHSSSGEECDKDAVTVIQMIGQAFSRVAYPDEGSIFYSSINPEAREYERDFAAKRWGDVIDAPFLRRHNMFPLFQPEGLRFYLPAYLIGRFVTPRIALSGLRRCVKSYILTRLPNRGLRNGVLTHFSAGMHLCGYLGLSRSM